jgi:broad specificity phosphatase PhoE
MDETAPGAIQTERSGAPIGVIVIARHGRRYDETGLAKDQSPPPALIEAARGADLVFSSTLPRAYETALAVAGGREINRDAVFVEAPLPPPPIWGKRRPGWWGVWARASWWLGRSAGMESRRAVEQRAQAAVATLTARALRGQNVLLCAHGWFNRMMRAVLRTQGWRCVYDGGDTYWSHRIYEKSR